MSVTEPLAEDRHSYAWDLLVRPREIERWRNEVAGALRAMGAAPEAVGLARLGISELLSNAVKHVPDPHCRLRVLRVGDAVLVQLYDRSRDIPVIPAEEPDPESPAGRGLWLLRQTATALGYTHTPDGKSVWFRTPLHPAGDALAF
ncbi:ATP-binding protein [Streptomyces aidingensis]|uniref:Anti-sigma regulatory factor (Ser/Thr protein kinase) n=1 Tax=Streptomyces aidingensis TaxID=910347 RepID=A0A1I1S1X9_9ACTN|nr:ATP-binding protein [Streptomyces aidingensis]SFD40347.1 Anti-sigma regulatory factor (Ser/Thr protein kinase) [Streptomyces aidingensis]